MLCCRCHREIPDESMFCNFCGKRQTGAPSPQRAKHRRAKGTGSVYRCNDAKRKKPWAVNVRGKTIARYATAGEACAALNDYMAAQIPVDLYNMTFAQAFEQWSEKHFPTVSKKAVTIYRNAFAHAASLHPRKMKDLKTADYQTVIDSISDKSRSLCEKQRQLFSQLCKFAQQQDVIDKNYAEFLILPKAAPIKDRVLSEDEIQRIWCMVDDKAYADAACVALALIYTGMRINELLSLRLADCHIADGYVTGGEKTEAGRDRLIPIHPDVTFIFEKWEKEAAGSEWLFPAGRGSGHATDGWVRKKFVALMQHLGIDGVSPHTCRHTAATIMANEGLPTDSIKRILGHTDYSFTSNRYTSTNGSALISDVRSIHSRKPLSANTLPKNK